MNLNEEIESISTKDEFAAFLEQLKRDRNEKSEEWSNLDLQSYLESISSWVNDMEGYYKNVGKSMPSDIDWTFIATLFYVGKIYE